MPSKTSRNIGKEILDGFRELKLENDPRFLARIESARQSLRKGLGVRIEDLGAKPRRPLQRTGKRRQH
jgi:hypothetical protein